MSDSDMKSMPALFVGHGNPMLTLSDNPFTRAWRALGETLPRPRAILAISAHWYLPGIRVTAMAQPRTIHDFGGFPKELFQVEYPAPGNPELAREIVAALAPWPVSLDQRWGLDHGTWSVLRHLFPSAQIPVLQLSLDRTLSPENHYRLGERLAALREAGLLILGSGNVVHNLAGYAWHDPSASPPAWAVAFEDWVRDQLLNDAAGLTGYRALGETAALAAPSPDHYLPLLYLAALRKPGEALEFPVDGFEGGTMSMLSAVIGR